MPFEIRDIGIIYAPKSVYYTSSQCMEINMCVHLILTTAFTTSCKVLATALSMGAVCAEERSLAH